MTSTTKPIIDQGVTMKQLISLLLIISITVISWSSCAKSTVIRFNYSQPSTAISSMVIKPSSSEQHINETFGFVSNQVTKKHNNFFELAIIFNEKLQQFIAFFTHLGDEVEMAANNDFLATGASPTNDLTAHILPAKNNQSTIKKCKASS
jgi:hypothetical protein